MDINKMRAELAAMQANTAMLRAALPGTYEGAREAHEREMRRLRWEPWLVLGATLIVAACLLATGAVLGKLFLH